MKNVLIIGGGLAGCAVAKELSAAGIKSCLVEKDARIGGKSRAYGCKSDEKCNNCGLCAVGSLWRDVEEDPNIRKLTEASVVDITGRHGDYIALIEKGGAKITESFAKVVVATGFEKPEAAHGAKYDSETYPRVFTGNALEQMLNRRSADGIFPEKPESVAFILCSGSRTKKDRAAYCSQVCCAYSTRSAKVIKHCYPDAEVTVFYMDLQAVNPGNYMKELTGKGISFVRCRPADIGFDGVKPVVSYEDAEGKKKRAFDYLVLSTGIHPDIEQNNALADISGLKLNSDGFIAYVKSPEETGVYLAGCAAKPMDIPGTIESAKNTAAALISSIKEVRAS